MKYNTFCIGENELIIKDVFGDIVSHLGITDDMDLLEYLVDYGVIKENTIYEYNLEKFLKDKFNYLIKEN